MGSRNDRINNEAARRRDAKIYGDTLKTNTMLMKKEVGLFLSDFKKKHKGLTMSLNKDLKQSNQYRIKESLRKKEVAAFMKNCHKKNQKMAQSLHSYLWENEKKRLQAAEEDARQREMTVLGNAANTREYLREFVFQHREKSRAMRKGHALYVRKVLNNNRDRVAQTAKYMNVQRKYLLELLDLDFGVKPNYD